MKTLVYITVFLLACTVAGNANAALARLDITATMTLTNGDNAPLSASFLLDTTTEDANGGVGSGRFWQSILEGTILIGDEEYFARTGPGANTLTVTDDALVQSDLIDVFGLRADIEAVDGGDTGWFVLQMYDSSHQAFDDTVFPEFDFGLNSFNVFDSNSTFPTAIALAGIDGVVGVETLMTSMSYTVVPLPAAGWLLLSTLAGLGFLRRR